MKKLFLFLLVQTSIVLAQSELVHTSQEIDADFYKDISANPQKYTYFENGTEKSWNYHAGSFSKNEVVLFWYIENNGKLSYFKKTIKR